MAGDAPTGEEIARSFVSIMGDTAPFLAALGGLAQSSQNPASRAGSAAAGYIMDSFEKGIAHMMSGDIGRAVEVAGKGLTSSVAGVISGFFRAALGETLGGVLGYLPSHLVSIVGDTASTLIGKSLTAIVGPIRAALNTSLMDWSLWTNRAVEAEAAMARFTATADLMGKATGFDAADLKMMAEGLSNVAGASVFSAREMRDAIQLLEQTGRLRGQVLRRTAELIPELAALKGIGATEAAGMLSMAVADPEHGMRRLRHAGVILGPDEQQRIKQLQETNGTVAAQSALVDILSQKWHGLSAAMADTTEGKLAALRSAWAGIGTSIGNVFLPLTKVLSETVLGVVQSISGTATPVLKDMANITQGWADSIRGFLKENEATFHEWGALIKDIVMNVYTLGRDSLRSLFAQLDTSGAKEFWGSFSSGVTDALNWVRGLTSSWSTMQAAANVAWLWVKDKALSTWEDITSPSTWAKLWESLKSGFGSVVEWLVDTLGKVSDFIGERLGAAITGSISSVFTGGKTAKFFGQVFDSATMGLFASSAEDKGKAAEAAAQRVKDALGAGPKLPGAGGDEAANAAKAERQKELDAAKELLGLKVKAANVLADAARAEADPWRALVERMMLLGKEGEALNDDVKGHVTSVEIGGLYKKLQESITPTAADPQKQQGRDINEIRRQAEQTVEQLKKAVDAINQLPNKINLGFT